MSGPGVGGSKAGLSITSLSMAALSMQTWNKLNETLGRTWRRTNDAQLGLAKLAIDTGYKSPAVYAWARRAGHAQVAPIKGVEGFNRAAPVIGPTHVDVTEGGKKLRRGTRLWTIAVSTFKSETYRYLRLVGADRRGNCRRCKMSGGLCASVERHRG